MIHQLAEAPTCFEVVGPNEELVDCPDCVVFFGAGTDARSCSVQRLRFERDAMESTVSRVRQIIRAKGRLHATWEVLSSVHPPSTIDRLLSLGMQRSSPPFAAIMALSAEPPAANPNVVVLPVDTIEEFQAHVRITHEAFGMLDRLPDELKRIEVDGARKLADRSFVRYVARIDGVPAGAAGFSTCTVGYDGSVACWGSNHFGQLGDGTKVDRAWPMKIEGLTALSPEGLTPVSSRPSGSTSAGLTTRWTRQPPSGQRSYVRPAAETSRERAPHW
jgi:Regulator of chromosome condensation (RCC1) repeat